MGGANIELSAIGKNDNVIMGNPQITFFKSVYKRHTNFSIESREIINSDSINFGSVDAEFTIKNVHHLLTKVYAEVIVSGTSDTLGKYTVNNFGNSLIKEASFIMGGKNIETLYSQWLQIYHELVNQSNYGTPDYYHTSKSDTTGGGKNMTYDFVSDNIAPFFIDLK